MHYTYRPGGPAEPSRSACRSRPRSAILHIVSLYIETVYCIIHIYIYIYMFMYMCIYIYIYTRIHMEARSFLDGLLLDDASMPAAIVGAPAEASAIYIYIYIYIHTCLCLYACIYIYIML